MLLLRRGTSQIDCIGQLLDRDLCITRRQTAQAATRAHQDIRQRIADNAENLDRKDRKAGEALGTALREYLGQNLTKKQQKERNEHRLDNELEDRAVEDK